MGPVPDAYRMSFAEVRDRYRTRLDMPMTGTVPEPNYAMLLRNPEAVAAP